MNLAPWSSETLVRDARDAYLAENGFSVEAYEEKWSRIQFTSWLGVSIPNPPSRQRGIRMHDLHHVVTGFGTDLAGEGEISVWELRRGLRGLSPYVRGIVLWGALGGLVLHPIRALRVWRMTSKTGGNLFDTDVSYETLLTMTVAELREKMLAPVGGLAGERALHAGAPR